MSRYMSHIMYAWRMYIAPAYNLVLWMYFVFKICIYKRETSKPASFEGVQYNSLFLELFPLPIINLIIMCAYIFTFLKQEFRQLKWWLMGMIMGPLIVFGFCGNLMSITVLLRRKMRCEAFNQLLASLCVIDTIFILCNSMSCANALRISRKYGIFLSNLYYLCKIGRTY